MQNHLMQVLSLVAMDVPQKVMGEDYSNYVRDAKVAVINKILPINPEDCVLGQYAANSDGDEGYLDHEDVPNESKCPTYAMATLYIDNKTWAGVPFIMKAGKALNERKAEVGWCAKGVCHQPSHLLHTLTSLVIANPGPNSISGHRWRK